MRYFMILFCLLLSCKRTNSDNTVQTALQVKENQLLLPVDSTKKPENKFLEYVCEYKCEYVGDSELISFRKFSDYKHPDIKIFCDRKGFFIKSIKNSIEFAVDNDNSILALDSVNILPNTVKWSRDRIHIVDWIPNKKSFAYLRIYDNNDTLYNWIKMAIDTSFGVLVYEYSLKIKK